MARWQVTYTHTRGTWHSAYNRSHLDRALTTMYDYWGVCKRISVIFSLTSLRCVTVVRASLDENYFYCFASTQLEILHTQERDRKSEM